MTISRVPRNVSDPEFPAFWFSTFLFSKAGLDEGGLARQGWVRKSTGLLASFDPHVRISPDDGERAWVKGP